MLIDSQSPARDRKPLKFANAWAAAFLGAANLVLPLGAWGAPPPQADPALSGWFESLANPTSGISCCAQYDGHILASHEWRALPDGYQVRIDGIWRDVPPNAVLNRVENPTGSAVAFYPLGGNPIYCFVRPTDS